MRPHLPKSTSRGKAWIVGCVLLVDVLSATPTSAQALFSITEAKFGSDVSPHPNFQVTGESKGQISRGNLHGGALWLMIMIVGDARTMRYLEDHQSLRLDADIWADGKKWDSAEIGMSYSDWEEDGEKLKSQLEGGFFTWRTRMRTTKIDASTIEVKFWDPYGNSLSPVGNPGSYVASIKIK